MTFEPEREAVRLRTGTVQSVSGGRATVLLGGSAVPGVPSHGRAPTVGEKVLVLEQGASMIILPRVN
jgi:hypothetical protein